MFSSSKIRRVCWRRGAPAAYFVCFRRRKRADERICRTSLRLVPSGRSQTGPTLDHQPLREGSVLDPPRIDCPKRGFRPGAGFPFRFLIALLALAAVSEALAAAAGPSAPLEEIKSELKALKRDKNPELGAPGTAPKISLPSFSPPEDASPPPPLMEQKPSAHTPQKDSSNWLLEGMDLQSDDRSQKTGSTNFAGDYSMGKMPDPSDPAYLLKVYAAQVREKKQREANERRRTGERASSSTLNPGAGPFGEFLGRWISAKNRSLLGLDKPPPTATGGAPAVLAPPGPTRRDAAERKANPFFEAMKPGPPPARTSSVPARQPETPRTVLPRLAAPANADSLPATPKPAPPPSPADDKKYFPQLSRF